MSENEKLNDAYRDAVDRVNRSTDKEIEALALGGHASVGARLNAAHLTIRQQAAALTAAEARIKALSEALERLSNECSAEFTVDGKWVNEGQLVRQSSVKRARQALSTLGGNADDR